MTDIKENGAFYLARAEVLNGEPATATAESAHVEVLFNSVHGPMVEMQELLDAKRSAIKPTAHTS